MKTLCDKLKYITEIISCFTLSDIDNLPYLLREFINSAGINLGLENENIREDQIKKLSQLAFEDSCHFTHPFPVTIKDFATVLSNSL
jgi:alcohol dehydrogenase class IV